ncbi:MAG: NAD-dependent epimerase/dehydratase family protein [Flammeovirgaceae bacterium]
MKYLITGCNGLVGSHTARLILKNGGSVRAIKRPNSDLSMLQDIKDQIEWHEADVLDILGLDRAVEGVDYVIHAAAMISFSPKQKTMMHKVNVEGTANVVNACIRHEVKKLCYISSVGAIGRPLKKHHLDETQKWEESPLNSQYGLTKYLGEQEVFRGIAEGLDAVIVNPSIILGTGDWSKSSTQLFKYVWDKKRFYPRGAFNYVDVRDVADAVFKLIHSPKNGERFILCAGNVKYTDFFSQVAHTFNRVISYRVVKAWMGEVAWRWEKLKSWLTGREPLITKETVRSSAASITFNGTKVTQEIDFQYRKLEDSIAWICRYFEEKSLNSSY